MKMVHTLNSLGTHHNYASGSNSLYFWNSSAARGYQNNGYPGPDFLFHAPVIV